MLDASNRRRVRQGHLLESERPQALLQTRPHCRPVAPAEFRAWMPKERGRRTTRTSVVHRASMKASGKRMCPRNDASPGFVGGIWDADHRTGSACASGVPNEVVCQGSGLSRVVCQWQRMYRGTVLARSGVPRRVLAHHMAEYVGRVLYVEEIGNGIFCLQLCQRSW